MGATAVVNAKSPPRPAPASVTYSDDDTIKGYDENPDDSSELTEKPTDLSSTASEVSDKNTFIPCCIIISHKQFGYVLAMCQSQFFSKPCWGSR